MKISWKIMAVCSAVALLYFGVAVCLGSFLIVGAVLSIFVLFSLPGIILLRQCRNREDLSSFFPASLTGISISIFCIGLIGTISHNFSQALVLAIPLFLSILFWFLGRKYSAPREKTKESWNEIIAWLALVITIICLFAPIYLSVGMIDSLGNHRFLPFFCADFFKHLAYMNTIASNTLPPVDPFHAGHPLHYYWLFHIIPASMSVLLGKAADPVKILLIVGWIQNLYLATGLFLLCRKSGIGPWYSLLTCALGIASLSFDGLAAWIINAPQPVVHTIQSVNMEGLDFSILFGIPSFFSASSLFRLCLYVPQHQLGALLVLAWALLFVDKEIKETKTAILARAGILISLPAVSLFIGAVALFAAIGLEAYTWRRKSLFPFAIAIISSGLGMLFCFCTGIISSGSPVVDIPVHASHQLLPQLASLIPGLISSFGVFSILAIAGAVRLLREKSFDTCAISLFIIGSAILAIVVSECLAPDWAGTRDMQLKASFLIGIALVPLAGAGMNTLFNFKRPVFASLAWILLLMGVPSPVQDMLWHNARIWNKEYRMRNCVNVPDQDMAALGWIRKNLPANALVQQYPQRTFIAGKGRDDWVPVFSGRKVFASDRGGAIPDGEIDSMRAIFNTCNDQSLWDFCQKNGIEYLYMSKTLQPQCANLFSTSNSSSGYRNRFSELYKNDSVRILKTSADLTDTIR
jgi:hypothetical protein